ncbi:MAG: hypothetical protein LLG20_16100 [Acidobacteriales bacterium]|nr:hypothetical protein [Terriglobales bacterium]
MKTRLSIIVLALVLTQAGCKTDPATALIASLSAVSSASAVAIAVSTSLESNGEIAEDTAREIIAYAQAVSEACAQSVAGMKAGTATKEKVLNILSAVAEVQTPVVMTYGNPKAQAVVVALDAALAALKVQLQAASKDAKASGGAVSPTKEQADRIRLIGRESQDAARAAASWVKQHREFVAAR